MRITLCVTKESYFKKPDQEGYRYQSLTIADNPVVISPDKLKDYIENGHAWTASTFCKDASSKRRRRLDYWYEQQIVAADLDDGKLTPEQALSLSRDNGIEPLLIHHTFSSTTNYPKLRVIYVLEDSLDEYTLGQQLWLKVGSIFSSDSSSGDIIKIYQGSVKGSVTHFNPEAILEPDDFGELPELTTPIKTLKGDLLYNYSGNQARYNEGLTKWQKGVLNKLENKALALLRAPRRGTKIGNTVITSRRQALFFAAVILARYEHCVLESAKKLILRTIKSPYSVKVWGDWDRSDDQLNNLIEEGFAWGRNHMLTYEKPEK